MSVDYFICHHSPPPSPLRTITRTRARTKKNVMCTYRRKHWFTKNRIKFNFHFNLLKIYHPLCASPKNLHKLHIWMVQCTYIYTIWSRKQSKITCQKQIKVSNKMLQKYVYFTYFMCYLYVHNIIIKPIFFCWFGFYKRNPHLNIII